MSIIKSNTIGTKRPVETRILELSAGGALSFLGEIQSITITSEPEGLTLTNPTFVGTHAYVQCDGGEAGIDYTIFWRLESLGGILVTSILQVRE